MLRLKIFKLAGMGEKNLKESEISKNLQKNCPPGLACLGAAGLFGARSAPYKLESAHEASYYSGL